MGKICASNKAVEQQARDKKVNSKSRKNSHFHGRIHRPLLVKANKHLLDAADQSKNCSLRLTERQKSIRSDIANYMFNCKDPL